MSGRRQAVVVAALGLLMVGLSPVSGRAVDASPEQACVEAALARPEVVHAEMRHAGILGVQSLFARVISPAMPSDCEGVVSRVQRFIFKVQNAVHRARWDPGLHGFVTFAIGNEAGRNSVYTTADSSGRGLYACTKGPRTTGAEVVIRLVAQTAGTHRPLAKIDYKAPIKRITPKRC